MPKATPDYSKFSDEKLATQIGEIRTLQKFLIGLSAFASVLFLGLLLISEDPLSALPLVAVILGAALFLVLMAKKYFNASIRNMEAELNRRKPNSEQIQEASVQGRKRSRLLIIVFVAIIVFASLIAITSNNSGTSNKNGCRNCGRTENIVPGFGFCEDCFEGFLDWQDRVKD